ncbi:MAG: TonB C-terminal domain-containing protein [Zoogloeaceae bacterium]|jgi:colicin import membrane protein|nr:TonB C-terminal domain-containing protein [Zoogloeaceae bacterium]
MPHEPLPEPGRKKALALTLAVHLALAMALFLGVQWKTRHVPVEVELWPSAPSPAASRPAPKAPLPAPEKARSPKRADILARDQRAPEKVPVRRPDPRPREIPPTRDFRRDDLVDAEERDLQRKRQEARVADLRNAAAEESASRNAAERKSAQEAAWVEKIRGKIHGNIILPPVVEGNPEAQFSIDLLPSGEIVGRPRLQRSSGNAALDAAIERAILKSSPLPRPDDPSVFQRELVINYKPFD